ncbi:MAG: hypothetical protein IT426_15835 [Pirellulales bacterium]|nr:hypothetical protein [Pirellulales bacterium]
METYRHSGAISPLGIILASSAGIAAAVVLGVAYSFAVVHIPIIYVNALLTFCFGWLMGKAVGWGAKTGKIRNPFVATAYGFLIGLIGLYVAWGTDFLARVVIPGGLKGNYWMAYSPNVIWGYMEIFYEKGFWGFKHGGNVSGIPLAIVWAIEAAMIVGGSTYFARNAIAHHPFCENCGRWTDIVAGCRHLSLAESQESLARLLSGDLAVLANFNLAQNENVFLQLDLASCPICAESCYLTIQQVTQTYDKEGKLKVETTPLLRNMSIDAEAVPLVLTAGREPPPEAEEEDVQGENPPETGETPKNS